MPTSSPRWSRRWRSTARARGGANPVQDKAQLVADLRAAVAAATAFCAAHGVDLPALEALPLGSLARLTAVEDAIDALIAPEARRRDFFTHAQGVDALHRAVKPDPAALEFAERVAGIAALAAAIRAKLSPNPPDIATILGQITGLLDDSITGLTMREAGPPPIDLSQINFAALAERFKASPHKNTDLEALKAAIRARLEKLIRLNRTRADFAEKFAALIESYNAGSRNIEQLFEELLKLSQSLDEEEARHVREHLSEEELVIFDILTRPAPDLTPAERAEVKKVARVLLARLQELLVLNWRQKAAARSALQMAIEDALDAGLPPAYAPESTARSAPRSSSISSRVTRSGTNGSTPKLPEAMNKPADEFHNPSPIGSVQQLDNCGFGKLQVSDRAEAILKAREAGIRLTGCSGTIPIRSDHGKYSTRRDFEFVD